MREAFKWGDTRLRTHLEELVEMEYVVPLSGRFGQRYQYRLVYDRPTRGERRFLTGLKSVEQLRQEANLAGVLTNLAPQKRDLAPTSQVEKREVQTGQNPVNTGLWLHPPANLAPFPGEHIGGLRKPDVNGAHIQVTNGGRP